MKLLGQSFNLMTLGGLAAAVGLVIDDKIVVVENIVLHRDNGEGPLKATASALKELTLPLVGSTLTPIVVFLPLITITGVTGTFFSALAIAMSVALLTSLVLALVWTSNLSTRLIRRGKEGHGDKAARDHRVVVDDPESKGHARHTARTVVPLALPSIDSSARCAASAAGAGSVSTDCRRLWNSSLRIVALRGRGPSRSS